MKPIVVKCPVTDVNIITPMPDGAEFPPEGIVYLECPCCRLPHHMPRDVTRFRHASLTGSKKVCP